MCFFGSRYRTTSVVLTPVQTVLSPMRYRDLREGETLVKSKGFEVNLRRPPMDHGRVTYVAPVWVGVCECRGIFLVRDLIHRKWLLDPGLGSGAREGVIVPYFLKFRWHPVPSNTTRRNELNYHRCGANENKIRNLERDKNNNDNKLPKTNEQTKRQKPHLHLP